MRVLRQAFFHLVGPLELGVRRLTARWRALPEAFILGAPKCGTTSMTYDLGRHPAYVPAPVKEIMFLQELPNFRSNWEVHPWIRFAWGRYSDDLMSYRKFFPLKRALQKAAERTGGRSLTGDHTPFYLYCPITAERIRRIAPNAKLIILLRDPVERTYSDYNMHIERNPDESRSFEQAIQDEIDGTCKDFRMTYLHQGIYEPHVRRWMEMFPREQLLVVDSAEYFRDRENVASRLYEFLELPPHKIGNTPVRNRGDYVEPMKSETREMLCEYFQPHNRRLRDLMGVDYGWS